MRKTLLSIALALLGLGAQAQVDETFIFCDSQGNVIPHGSVINVTEGEEDFMTGDLMMHSGLYVKYNGAGNGGYAGMALNIKQIDNGKLKHCFPGLCKNYTAVGEIIRDDVTGVKAGTPNNIQSEWVPAANGLCTVSYTLRATTKEGVLQAQGATVTVNYCNGVPVPDAVNGVRADVWQGKTYNLQGQVVNSHYKGVVIKNGKKYIY